MKSICVFCGSSAGTNPVYTASAQQSGVLFAQRRIKVVYGGGNIGLMGVLADACLQHGGEVLGVIPGFMKEKEVCHMGLTELIVTKTMHERKQVMEQRSDASLILPGGFGTLDEFFEILTWRQLHLHNKPIGVLNVNGFYDSLFSHVEHLHHEGFMKSPNLELFCVSESIEDLLEKMAVPFNLKVEKWL